MKTRILWLAPVLLLSLSGCAEEYETRRAMAEQPFFNGYNAGWIAFLAAVASVLMVCAIASATAHVLVERRRSRERVEVARLRAEPRSEVADS